MASRACRCGCLELQVPVLGLKGERMSRKGFVVFGVMVFVLVSSMWAEPLEPTGTVFERFPSSLGAYINYPVGGGLTYQRWFDRVGMEATIGAIADPSGTYNYNAQAAFQYMLYGEDFADWFSGALYTNVFLAHRGEGATAAGSEFYDPYVYLGLGVGIEMVFLRHLSTSVEFMYVGSYPLALDFGFGGSLKYRY